VDGCPKTASAPNASSHATTPPASESRSDERLGWALTALLLALAYYGAVLFAGRGELGPGSPAWVYVAFGISVAAVVTGVVFLVLGLRERSRERSQREGR
jgi:hypothetical protein